MERINFDKKCRLDKVCTKEEVRPVFNYIFFKNGYAYVSDTHIMIRANLHAISNLPQETIDALNGHCIDKDLYIDLLKCSTFKIIGDEIISYEEDKESGELIEDCAFSFGEKKLGDDFFGDRMEQTYWRIMSEKSYPTTNFSFDPSVMTKLIASIGYKGNFIFSHTEMDKWLVYLADCSTNDKQNITAVFMPVIPNECDIEYIEKRY